MQTAEHWLGLHWPLNCALHRHWCFEAQCPVRPVQLVVLDKLGEDRPEVLLVEDDEMVQAFSA
jgi:hypothetical protein